LIVPWEGGDGRGGRKGEDGVFSDVTSKARGKAGQRGGDAGKGGVGGLGGHGGGRVLVDFGKKIVNKVPSKHVDGGGVRGASGRAGEPGLGG